MYAQGFMSFCIKKTDHILSSRQPINKQGGKIMTNQGSSTDIQAAIEAANEVFMATFKRGDTPSLADLYT